MHIILVKFLYYILSATNNRKLGFFNVHWQKSPLKSLFICLYTGCSEKTGPKLKIKIVSLSPSIKLRKWFFNYWYVSLCILIILHTGTKFFTREPTTCTRAYSAKRQWVIKRKPILTFFTLHSPRLWNMIDNMERVLSFSCAEFPPNLLCMTDWDEWHFVLFSNSQKTWVGIPTDAD